MSMIPNPSHGLDVEEMLNRLNNDSISVVIFGPCFFGAHYGSHSKWNVQLKREDNGVKIELNELHEDLKEAVSAAYDKWHSVTAGGLANHFGVPAIEHQPPAKKTAAELEKEDNERRFGGDLGKPSKFDDEIPF